MLDKPSTACVLYCKLVSFCKGNQRSKRMIHLCTRDRMKTFQSAGFQQCQTETVNVGKDELYIHVYFSISLLSFHIDALL